MPPRPDIIGNTIGPAENIGGVRGGADYGRHPHQAVRIISKGPKMNAFFALGIDPPVLTGGFGGWESIARQDEVALTGWNGVDPLGMELPLMVDAFDVNKSIEKRVENLIDLARPFKNGPPPVIRVFGPIPYSGRHWVVTGISMGDMIRNKHGKLVRQSLALELLEYVRPDVLKIKKRKKKSNNNRPGPTDHIETGDDPGDRWGGKYDQGIPGPLLRWYVVKEGDNLFKLAVKFYSERDEWKTLAEANNIRDPHAEAMKKYVGKKIKIPEL